MATKKFPSEMSSRGTVKVTDKLMICNIDTGDTCYTTVAELLTAFNIATLNGNVGIGTLSPAKLLEINTVHTYNIDDEIRIGSYHNSNFYGLSLNYRIDGSGNPLKYLVEYDGGTRYNSISLNIGNVGIGTTAPSSKLQVVGLNEYADNTTALGAGLTAGAFYRTGDLLKVVH